MESSAGQARESPQSDRQLVPPLFVLTLTTGLVDAVSYLGLGNVFTANMTGNVVLLGFGVADAQQLPIVAPLVSLGGFLAGAIAGGRLALRYEGRHVVHFPLALTIELLLVVCATVVAAATDPDPDSGAAYAVIALLALAMGARTATVRALSVPDLRTTVLTMTLASLAADSQLAGGSGRRSIVRLGAAAAMLVGALVGALLQKQGLVLPLVVIVGIEIVTIAGYVGVKAGGRRARMT